MTLVHQELLSSKGKKSSSPGEEPEEDKKKEEFVVGELIFSTTDRAPVFSTWNNAINNFGTSFKKIVISY